MSNSPLPILPARPLSRRELLFRAGAGFSGLALTSLLDQEGLLAATPADPKSGSGSTSPLANILSPSVIVSIASTTLSRL